MHHQTLPWGYTVAIGLATVIGKTGDAFGPTLLTTRPLLLLMLNSNDLHLALSSRVVARVPWFLVGMTRRLVEDPLFFIIGESDVL